MKKTLKDAFTSNGIFLNKKISIHLALQKGRENAEKRGSFDLDVEGCSNLARKGAILIVILCFLGGCFAMKTKNENIFKKRLTIQSK